MDRQEKPFWDHLDELRARFVRCLYIFLVCSAAGYLVRMPVLAFLKAPLFRALPPERQHLYFTGLFESFFNHLTIAMLVGAFIGSPYFIAQIWGFISPGLHVREKKFAVPFVFFGTLFFFMGAAFSYYLVLPVGFKFFVEFGAPQDTPMITVREYFSTLFRLLLLFGLSFEFPVILVFMARIGLISSRVLKKHRRNTILGISIVSAISAPPDIMSMLLMMTPLYLFFEGAIFVIVWLEKNKKTSQESA